MSGLTTEDLGDDFSVFDWTVATSYQRRDLTGNILVNYTVLGLKRASRGTLVSFGESQEMAETARWHLRSTDFPEGVSPRRGDRIVSAVHGTWELSSDDVETLGTRFVCETVRIPE